MHKSKSNVIHEIRMRDEMLYNLQEIVQIFNNYYVNLPISLEI